MRICGGTVSLRFQTSSPESISQGNGSWEETVPVKLISQ